MRIIIYISVLMLALGCETTLSDFELEEKPKKQVLNALVGNDTTMTMHLSVSSGILDPEVLTFIDNSNVTVYQNGNPIAELTNIENGLYTTGNVFQQPGLLYTVESTHPFLPKATASFRFPEKAEILRYDTNWTRTDYEAEYDTYGAEYLNITVEIQDPVIENSYFLIQLIKESYTYIYDESKDELDSVLTSSPIYIESIDGSAQLSVSDSWVYERSSEDEQSLSGYGIVYSDRLLSTDVLNFSFKSSYWEFMNDGMTSSVEITLSVKHISKEYYLFLRSFAQYDEALYNPFAQNVNVFTNVEGGFGIVAAYTQSKKIIPVNLRDRKD